jgi:hypothetical protein
MDAARVTCVEKIGQEGDDAENRDHHQQTDDIWGTLKSEMNSIQA